jgi:hypothetical protein
MNFTLIALSALAVAGVANAADDYAPPPGLYRVDTDSTMSKPGGTLLTVQTNENGATGGVTRSGSGGVAATTRQYRGEGPVTVCVKAPLKEMPAELVPAGACSSSAPVVRGGVATFKSSCAFGDITTTMRKVDAKTWESVTHTVQKSLTGGAGGIAANISMMRAGLERQAKEGTPEQREEARQALAQFEQYKAAVKTAGAAEAGAATRSATISDSVMTSRMTRIADTCEAKR